VHGDLTSEHLTRATLVASISIDPDADRMGPGKIQLLEAINSCGSISAAGRAMRAARSAGDFGLTELDPSQRYHAAKTVRHGIDL
jgi:hypothetical protein